MSGDDDGVVIANQHVHQRLRVVEIGDARERRGSGTGLEPLEARVIYGHPPYCGKILRENPWRAGAEPIDVFEGGQGQSFGNEGAAAVDGVARLTDALRYERRSEYPSASQSGKTLGLGDDRNTIAPTAMARTPPVPTRAEACG